MWEAFIDWADRHHDTVVIDEAGRKVAWLPVEHSPDGLKKKELALLVRARSPRSNRLHSGNQAWRSALRACRWYEGVLLAKLRGIRGATIAHSCSLRSLG